MASLIYLTPVFNPLGLLKMTPVIWMVILIPINFCQLLGWILTDNGQIKIHPVYLRLILRHRKAWLNPPKLALIVHRMLVVID